MSKTWAIPFSALDNARLAVNSHVKTPGYTYMCVYIVERTRILCRFSSHA